PGGAGEPGRGRAGRWRPERGGAAPAAGDGGGPAAGERPARPAGSAGRERELRRGDPELSGVAGAAAPGAECRAGPGDESALPAASVRGTRKGASGCWGLDTRCEKGLGAG